MITDDAVEKGCFAGAVWTDKTDDFALLDLKGDMVVRHQSAKIFDKIVTSRNAMSICLFLETAR